MSISINRTYIITLSIATTAYLLVSNVNTAHAEIYKWRNDRGVIQYSDKPPVAGFSKINRNELVNALQAKDLCVEPTAKTAAASSNRKFSANFFGATPTSGFGLGGQPVAVFGIPVAPKPATVTVATAPKPATVTVATAPKPATVTVATAPKPATVTVATAPVPVTRLTPQPTVVATATSSSTPTSSTPNIIQSALLPAVDISKQAAPALGESALLVQSTNEQAPYTAGQGAFRISCGFSHMSNDDPIIYPNQQGAAHHHTFFGNTSANYKTNPATLSTTGNSTCNGGIMNRSAYWVPSMIDTANNSPIKPNSILVYYKTDNPSQVVQPPKGLRMIAGNAKAIVPQDSNVRYTCNEDYNTRKLHIPACSAGGTMEILLHFPQCWDGVNLDSPDHKSHMAYLEGDSCPANHPVLIPNISYNVHYTVGAAGTSKWRLASDNYAGGTGGNSFHGDWMNGWDENFSKVFTDNCLKKGLDCRAHLLGDGRMF